jgi:hypothetical protein
MCNIYLLYYTNASSTSTDGRQFYGCQGNNFPELVSKIPSTSNQQMDPRISVNGETSDDSEWNDNGHDAVVNPIESVDDRPLSDRYSSQITNRRRDKGVWQRQFVDQTPDENDFQQTQYGRYRHRPPSAEFRYDSDDRPALRNPQRSSGRTIPDIDSSAESDLSNASVEAQTVQDGLSTPTVPATQTTTTTAATTSPPPQNSQSSCKFARRI